MIEGDLEEMYARAHEEEKKLKEQIFLKNAIITELNNKYHFDRICASIEKFNDFLPSLIDYIDNPTPKSKKSLKKDIESFIKCLEDG